jgi:sortase A
VRPEPRRSFVTIPAIGLRDFPVVRYRGSPDDAPGTAIQNAGDMASPRGPRGGSAPGEVGNFIVTGHRLTGTAPLRYSPSMRRGDRIRVRTGDTVFVYEVRRTRWTSFREPASLRAQRSPVPGRPGEAASTPMITISTCATLEDHADGNYWSDEFDNPEHRIDKIGVLVATRPA